MQSFGWGQRSPNLRWSMLKHYYIMNLVQSTTPQDSSRNHTPQSCFSVLFYGLGIHSMVFFVMRPSNTYGASWIIQITKKRGKPHVLRTYKLCWALWLYAVYCKISKGYATEMKLSHRSPLPTKSKWLLRHAHTQTPSSGISLHRFPILSHFVLYITFLWRSLNTIINPPERPVIQKHKHNISECVDAHRRFRIWKQRTSKPVIWSFSKIPRSRFVISQ